MQFNIANIKIVHFKTKKGAIMKSLQTMLDILSRLEKNSESEPMPQGIILGIMDEIDNDTLSSLYDQTFNKCLDLLKLKDKTEPELISLITLTRNKDYQKYICEACLPFLKSEDIILQIIERFSKFKNTLNIGIKALRLEEKADDEILEIAGRLNYKPDFCGAIISFLKPEKKLMKLIKLTEYNDSVVDQAITLLKTEDNIMKVLKKSHYRVSLCLQVIASLKSMQNIIKLMEKTKHDQAVCQISTKTMIKLQVMHPPRR